MDRRSFLRSAGRTASGSVIAGSSDAKVQSNENSARSNILSNDLTQWSPSSLQPWDVHTINHLYRRGGFGATLAEIAAAKGKIFTDVVDSLLDNSLLTKPTFPPVPGYSNDTLSPPSWLQVPPYAYTSYLTETYDYLYANAKIRSHWAVQMNQPETMLREKLTLFWMNHFVIEAKKVIWPQLTYGFLTYLRQNAWGNFKKMVSDVTILPGMLYYLDGVVSVGNTPNENYARELQELFTMGLYYKNDVTQPNYTQSDVEAIAKALTGWTIYYQSPPPDVLPSQYNANFHNQSPQAIYDGIPRKYNLTASGDTFDMDLIDHMFTVKGTQIAWYICSKLYQNFVYHDISGAPEQSVIEAMAALLIQSNWELKPVISALLKSAHFFEEGNIGAGIKSPYEHMIGLFRTFDISIDELAGGTLYYLAVPGAQELLDPPNVKGWPGYRTWISVATLPNRNVITTQLVSNGQIPGTPNITDGYGNNFSPVNLLDDAIIAWGKQFTNWNGTFDDMVKELATYLCAQTPSDKALSDFVKSGFPAGYEWGILTDVIKVPTLRLITSRVMNLADYQLS